MTGSSILKHFYGGHIAAVATAACYVSQFSRKPFEISIDETLQEIGHDDRVPNEEDTELSFWLDTANTLASLG